MPEFAEGTIVVTISEKKIHELFNNTPEEIKFNGNIEEGDFEIEKHSIKGFYRSSNLGDGTLTFRIVVVKKPWYATIDLIESKLNELIDSVNV